MYLYVGKSYNFCLKQLTLYFLKWLHVLCLLFYFLPISKNSPTSHFHRPLFKPQTLCLRLSKYSCNTHLSSPEPNMPFISAGNYCQNYGWNRLLCWNYHLPPKSPLYLNFNFIPSYRIAVTIPNMTLSRSGYNLSSYMSS